MITFWGANKPNGYMSNWFMSDFTYNPKIHTHLVGCKSIHESPKTMFLCVEQFMMWAKARLFKDFDIANVILQEENPKRMKTLGRDVSGFDNAVWSTWRYDIVYLACMLKFSQNQELNNKLVSTGNSIIVEASPYDKIWGVGLSDQDSRINNPDQWLGLNLLGKTLMEVRQILQMGYE